MRASALTLNCTKLIAIASFSLVASCASTPPSVGERTLSTQRRAAPEPSVQVETNELARANAAPPQIEKRVAQAFLPPAAPDFLSAPLPAPGPSLAKFRQQARINVGFGYLTQPTLLPEDLIAIVSDDEAKLRVYHAPTKRLVGAYAVPNFSRFHTGPIAKWPGPVPKVLAASETGLLLIDAKSGRVEGQLSDKAIHVLRWSPDEKILITVSGGARDHSDVSFFQRENESLRHLRTLAVDERVDGVDLSRDHRLLALVQYPSNTARVLDLANDGSEVLRVHAPVYAGTCAISPNGRLLAVGGAGVLVVDLLNASRRGFYSHIYNNVGYLQFTPAGDALIASAFDGRIRAFSVTGPNDKGLGLSLLGELRHGGNVYGLAMTADGRMLVSGSGDKTMGIFTGTESAASGGVGERFRSLAEWNTTDPNASRPIPEVDLGRVENGRYVVPALSAPARPSRITPGRYQCKVAAIYKLRDCTVERDADGRTILTFLAGNLLPLRGVLYDDGDVVRYEAALLEDNTVVACEGCSRQPLQGFFRGKGASFEGLLTFRTVFDSHQAPPVPPANATIEEALDRFPMSLKRKD